MLLLYNQGYGYPVPAPRPCPFGIIYVDSTRSYLVCKNIAPVLRFIVFWLAEFGFGCFSIGLYVPAGKIS